MRDGQLEDRLRGVLRTEGDALSLTITTAELERQMELRRRERVGRRAGVLAAAVAVVAVGSLVVATNGWFQSSGVGTGPSAVPTASPVPSRAALPCETVDVADSEDPPAVVLGTRPGDSIAHQGVVTAFRIGNTTGEPPADWSGLEPFMVETSVQLEALASSPDACIEELQVTYLEARQGESLPPVFPSFPGLTAISMGGPARVIEFDPPATAGDWFIRVKAVFATDPPDVAWTEAVFRIVVPDSSASPSDLPAVLPELTAPEGVILFDESSSIDAPGEPTGVVEVIGLAPVPPRSAYQVDVTCLGSEPIRWSLGLEGEFGFMAAGDQACDGSVGSQTLELGIPPGDVPVFVQADPATAWHVVVSSIAEQPAFLPPSLRGWWTAETGSSAAAAEAFGHCVSSAAGADQCGPNWDTAADARRIRVTSGFETTISFQLQDEWDVAQARVTAVAAGTTAPEYSVGFIDELNREIRVPMELEPGQWTLQVSLNAKRSTETFGASYNFLVEVAE